ncbi:MAG TPA: FtsL-like putative cell division protein [Chryseolinea sp.]|nr:FtsL-like putative cell division protein [Chryseolinea sp.]HPM31183.1 FtsL-like putative cell division protein [Chryseolinea sp.]
MEKIIERATNEQRPSVKEKMTENKFKINPIKSTGNSSGAGFFSGIEKRLKLESYFEEGFPTQHLPKILFAMLLSLLYISNTHYAEKTVREINSIHAEVEDLRADYTTLKSDLMFASKQSEVARKVKALGLKESLRPPYKISVEKGEY